MRDFVERRAVLVGARKEALERAIDQTRIQLRKRGIVQPFGFKRIGPEILEKDVGSLDELAHGFKAILGVEVEHEALFVSVESDKEARPGPFQAAAIFSLRPGLDLNHFGAKVCEYQAAGRPHDHVRKLDDANAAQRQW